MGIRQVGCAFWVGWLGSVEVGVAVGVWIRRWTSSHRAVMRLICAALVFFAALLVRLYGIESKSIWADEDAQARRVLAGGFDLGLIDRAATQQQPPLDYYAEYLGFQLFGVTSLGARAHAAVFGALAVLMVYLLLRRVFVSHWPVALGTLLALGHPVLLYYSQEARPISCGVFFSTLTLFLLYQFMECRGSRVHLLWGTALLAGTTAFLLSLGLQPVIYLAAASLALLPALSTRTLRLRALAAWCIFGGAFGLAWQVLRLLLHRGERYVERASTLDRLREVLAQAGAPTVDAWTGKLVPLTDFLWPLAIPVLALGLVGFALDCRDSAQRPMCRFTGFLLLFILVFPWLFDSVFKALVDYDVVLRYFATLAPVLLLTLAALVHHARRVLIHVAALRRPAAMGSIACVVVVLSWTALVQVDASLEALHKQKRDWASMYALFKGAERRGVAYTVYLDDPRRPRYGYYSQRFYYTPKDRRPVQLRYGWSIPADYERRGGPMSRPVYLVVQYGWHKIRRLRRQLEAAVPQAEVHVYWGMAVIEIQHARNSRKPLRRVFETLVKRLKPNEQNFSAYETLAWLRLHDGDIAGASALTRSLEKMKAKSLEKLTRKLRRAIKHERQRQRQRRQARAERG